MHFFEAMTLQRPKRRSRGRMCRRRQRR